MKRHLQIFLTAAMSFVLVAAAAMGSPVSFKLLRKKLPQAAHVTIDTGIIVDTTDWNSLIVASIQTGTDRSGQPTYGNCTGSFIGPTVLLTAAHCLFDSGTHAVRNAELGVDGIASPLTLTCDVDPLYISAPDPLLPTTPRASADFAVCHVGAAASDLSLLEIDRFESLALRHVYPLHNPVVMSGYGCTNWHLQNGAPVADNADGNLRIGDAKLAVVPSGAAPYNTYYSVVAHLHDGPALCPGDSGGPLFANITADHSDGNRLIIGVNSSITMYGGVEYLLSDMAATGTQEFYNFLTGTYLRHNPGDKICGVNLTVGTRPCH